MRKLTIFDDCSKHEYNIETKLASCTYKRIDITGGGQIKFALHDEENIQIRGIGSMNADVNSGDETTNQLELILTEGKISLPHHYVDMYINIAALSVRGELNCQAFIFAEVIDITYATPRPLHVPEGSVIIGLNQEPNSQNYIPEGQDANSGMTHIYGRDVRVNVITPKQKILSAHS